MPAAPQFSLFICMHAASQIVISTVVTASAESVDGRSPTARVTWNTTIPPECVASVRVEFRSSYFSPVLANYTTTNTSETEIIQTGLQCATNYYIRVVLTGATSDGVNPTVGRHLHLLVGGE